MAEEQLLDDLGVEQGAAEADRPLDLDALGALFADAQRTGTPVTLSARRTSLTGAAFYRLPPNQGTLTLTRGDAAHWPARIETGAGPVTVFDPGFPVHWHVSPDPKDRA